MTPARGIAASGMAAPPRRHDVPEASPRPATMDSTVIPGCMFCDCAWYDREIKMSGALARHKSDELIMLVGSDRSDPEDLGAELVYQIENDVLTLTRSCFLFIPAGRAHGLLEVRRLRRPVLSSTCFYDESDYEDTPAVPTEPAGRYAKNFVERYEPIKRDVPNAPAEFIQPLLWIDNLKLPGAPYMEAVWFFAEGFRGPEPHTHSFDEVIGFLGTDPEHPEELGGEVQFIMDGVTYTSTKSFYLFAPRGVSHSPIIIPRLERPVIHFSGGGRETYVLIKDE